MAEVNEQQVDAGAEQQQEQLPAQGEITKSRAGLVFGIVIVICIIVLAGSGFYLLQQLREQQDMLSNQDELKLIEISKQMNGFQSQLAAMQSQIATFDADITGKDNHYNKTLADFSQLHNEKLDNTRKLLEDSVSQLRRQLGKTRGDWLIADAEYLLSVANQRLHLVGDLNTTREALEAADQRLRESGDASVFKVRELIAKELAELRTVLMPDVVGMYSTIQLLKDKVQKLAVFLPYSGKELTQSESVHEHTLGSDGSHGLLGTLANQLEGYVTIRHTDKPVDNVLTPEQALFIRNQLGVKLEMIKLALVQQNDELYKNAIADAKAWLAENFSTNKDAISFAAELDRLNSIPIRGKFPDISESLKMLRDVTKLRIESDKAMLKPDVQQQATEQETVQ